MIFFLTKNGGIVIDALRSDAVDAECSPEVSDQGRSDYGSDIAVLVRSTSKYELQQGL